jgi:hypothetical protein
METILDVPGELIVPHTDTHTHTHTRIARVFIPEIKVLGKVSKRANSLVKFPALCISFSTINVAGAYEPPALTSPAAIA